MYQSLDAKRVAKILASSPARVQRVQRSQSPTCSNSTTRTTASKWIPMEWVTHAKKAGEGGVVEILPVKHNN